MTRRDSAYWQQLRRDRRSNAAAILTAIAVISATVSIITTLIDGSQSEARASPAYWLLMLPMAWWVSGLASFESRYVRSWMPVLAAACMANTISFAGGDDWLVSALGVALTLVAAGSAAMLYRGSLVAREGPAR